MNNMKEKLYRKVLISDRLPPKHGKYDTDRGSLFFHEILKVFHNRYISDAIVEYWFEEVIIPSEEWILNT